MAVKKGPKKGSAGGKGGGAVAETGLTQDSLKASAGLWKSTPTPEAGSFGEMKDGKRQAVIEEAIIENGGKQRDRLQVKWAFRITGPTDAGRMAWMNTGLGDDKSVEFTKRALVTLNLPVPDEIEKLPDILAQAEGLPVEINLVTKPYTNPTTGTTTDYQNTYLNKRLDVAAAPAAGQPAASKEAVSFVGQHVEFDGENNAKLTGKVDSQAGDTLQVKDAAGEIWEMTVADVRIIQPPAPPADKPKAAASAPGPDLTGKTVEFDNGEGTKVSGVVLSMAGENCNVKVGNEEWEVPAAEVKEVVAGPAKRTIKKK